MTKLCPRGKAAAKRKFRVYPSAYANAYASKICAGKIKDPSGVKRKDFRGSKAEGGLMEATAKLKRQGLKEGGNSKSRTNPDNLTGAQIRELEKLNLLDKGMRDKVTNLPVVSSRKIAGPVKGVLRNTFEQSKKPKKNRSKPKFKAMGGRINYRKGGGADTGKKGEGMSRLLTAFLRSSPRTRSSKRTEKMGGGMMRPMYRKGGGVCLRGMNKEAVGKNS